MWHQHQKLSSDKKKSNEKEAFEPGSQGLHEALYIWNLS